MDTLNAVEIGEVCNFDYKQPYGGDTRRHLARVVAIKRLRDQDVDRINAMSRYRSNDPEFIRTGTIVTCQMLDGGYKNFYAERTEKCRKSMLLKILFWTGLGRLMFR